MKTPEKLSEEFRQLQSRLQGASGFTGPVLQELLRSIEAVRGMSVLKSWYDEQRGSLGRARQAASIMHRTKTILEGCDEDLDWAVAELREHWTLDDEGRLGLGASDARRGKLLGKRPLGSASPKSKSVSALPHSCPGYQSCSAADTCDGQGVCEPNHAEEGWSCGESGRAWAAADA